MGGEQGRSGCVARLAGLGLGSVVTLVFVVIVVLMFLLTDRTGTFSSVWWIDGERAVVLHQPRDWFFQPARARLIEVSLLDGRVIAVHEEVGRPHVDVVRPPGDHLFVQSGPTAYAIRPLARLHERHDLTAAIAAHEELRVRSRIKGLVPGAILVAGPANEYAILADGRIRVVDGGAMFSGLQRRPTEDEAEAVALAAAALMRSERFDRERRPQIGYSHAYRPPARREELRTAGLVLKGARFPHGADGAPVWVPQASGVVVHGEPIDSTSSTYTRHDVLVLGDDGATRWRVTGRDLFGPTRLRRWRKGGDMGVEVIGVHLAGDLLWLALRGTVYGSRSEDGSRSVYYDLRMVGLDAATGALLRRITDADLLQDVALPAEAVP